jgi:hypothetical protein
MSKMSIDVEVYPSIELDGINTAVYIGETDQPFECMVSWEDIVENEVSMHTIPSGPIVVSESSNGVENIFEIIETLRDVARKLEDEVRSRDIFLRDLWVADGHEYGTDTRDDYVVNYEGYLDYIVNQENENDDS